MPLSLEERRLIVNEISASNRKDGGKLLSQKEWRKIISRRSSADEERLTLSDYLTRSHDLHLGQRVLRWTSRLGIGFFALAGAHTAGEAGMHVFGATLVGCITALGGGTVNGIVTGAGPVGWVRDPTFLALTIGASVVGFYVWPLAERLLPVRPVVRDGDGGGCDGGIDGGSGGGGAEDPSVLRYTLESIALGSLAVVGAQQGIVRGCHPVVSAVLGVTIAFGGVLRDLMCGRDLTLGVATGCQSYGIASFSGAAVYVALRELHVWNCAGSAARLVHGGIPIGLRIGVGFGTALGVRAAAWRYEPDGIFLSMDASAAANYRWIEERFFASSPSPPSSLKPHPDPNSK